jgi:DNA mismatch repair protein MutS2
LSTFSSHIVHLKTSQSRALTIAAKLGLPRFLLDHAEKVLGRREQDWREFLRQLEGDRVRLLEETETLKAREAALGKDLRILAQREETLAQQQEKLQRDVKEKVQRVMDFLDHESKHLVKELKEKQKTAATLNADRVGTEIRERIQTIEQIAQDELKMSLPRATPQKEPTELR